MATKNAKTSKMDVTKNIENIKSMTKDVNNFVLQTSEELVDTAIVRGEQWQKVSAKAIKGGLKLAATQQDIMFTTLEAVKGQLMTGTKRFQKLYSKN